MTEATGELLDPADPFTERRTCRRCRIDKFLGTGFRKLLSGDYAVHCMDCERVIQDKKQAQDIKEFVDGFDTAQLNLLRSLMQDTKPKVMYNTPHLLEIFEEVVRVFGGSKGYAHHVMAQYLSASPGGMIRQRILDIIYQMTKACSELNYTKKPDEMSDDELKTEILDFNKRLGLIQHDGGKQGISDAGERAVSAAS